MDSMTREACYIEYTATYEPHMRISRMILDYDLNVFFFSVTRVIIKGKSKWEIFRRRARKLIAQWPIMVSCCLSPFQADLTYF